MAQDEPGLRCDSDVVLVRRDGAQPRGATSAFDRGDISLMASHDAVVRKLRAVYRDPVEIAEAPGLPRRDLVTRDDVSSFRRRVGDARQRWRLGRGSSRQDERGP